MVGGDGPCSAPARLSARGAGPDVTLVSAAAHGLPDALSPALRGRGARGAAAAAGRGVGRDGTASGAGARVRGPRFAFCSSAAVYVFFFFSFFPPFFFSFSPCNFEHFASLSDWRQVRASCTGPEDPAALSECACPGLSASRTRKFFFYYYYFDICMLVYLQRQK